VSEPNAPSTQLPAPPAVPDTGPYSPQDSAAALVSVLDHYLADLQAGRAPERAKLLADHPELASQLEQCLAGMEFVHRASQLSAEAPAQLGDFRMVREIGRGGMGVVYEAEQLSLKRKVALKILRFGVATDAEAMRRFQREAETVAGLHHTNIVPVFAVGCEQGVHYYAMQYVEGRGLEAVLEAAKQEGRLPAAAEIARWGLQAAEALAHAHQRGVIHRDIKPSNLLLDQEGTVWLTDFGLAKRVDEVTLTVAGVLLGTPRYMSPEQASTVRQPIDQRTDIYSLGATLYELSTGRPAFDADTPQAVLAQIVHAEPASPRQLRHDLPRDLETIILKCLAKEPAQRYATAQELAEDFRAFLDERAIKARRPSLAERAVRWARKQRRSAVLAAATAVASVLLVVGSYLLWHWYMEWRQGQFFLATDGPALEAEVFDANDELVIPPFTVPTRQPVSLPGGLYRVRLSAPGQLSETYQMLVEQGLQSRYEVGLGARQLWEPLDVSQGFEVVNLDGRSDVIVFTDHGLLRINGATGKEVWTRTLDHAERPGAITIKEKDWRYFRIDPGQGIQISSRRGVTHFLESAYHYLSQEDPIVSWLVQPTPDLDGDGSRYLILASVSKPWLLAISAKDGAVKWWYQSQSPAPMTTHPALRGPGSRCPPVLADVDGDGIPDVITVFGSPDEGLQSPRWVEAISGRTGHPLWRYTFEPSAPVRTMLQAPTHFQARYSMALTQEGDRQVLVIVVCQEEYGQRHEGASQLLVVDLKTGKRLRPPAALGFESMNTPGIIDLEGDGHLGVLLVRRGERNLDLTLTAIDLSGTPLWEQQIKPTSTMSQHPAGPMSWPVVADLNGDGKPELLVPYGAPFGKGGWIGIEVLEAATGKSRWRRALCRAYDGSAEHLEVAHLLAGPDLDEDGHREVFTAALLHGRTFDEEAWDKQWLFVAACSGRDGRILWQTLQPVEGRNFLEPLRWGPPGTDGRSCLIVGVAALPGQATQPPVTIKDHPRQTFFFAVSTGRLEHCWPGVFQVATANFMDNGLVDIYGLSMELEKSAKLRALRGVLPESWRRLGTWYTSSPRGSMDDFDRGAAGSICRLAPPLPHGDLDGDGTADLLVFRPENPSFAKNSGEPPLRAYSGKDGHRLWTAALDRNNVVSQCFRAEYRQQERSGEARVLVAYGVGGANEGWLAMLSGPTGRLMWKEKLGGFRLDSEGNSYPLNPFIAMQLPGFADINGDGLPDLVVWREMLPQKRVVWPPISPNQELCAMDGRNGRTLWRQPLPLPKERAMAFAVGQIVKDSSEQVIVASSTIPIQLQGLDVKSGLQQWTWTGPADLGYLTFEGSSSPTVPVLVDLDGRGRRSICLLVAGNQGYQILVLDPPDHVRHCLDIKPLASDPLRPPLAPEKGGFRLWSQDLQGDSKESLLYVSDGRVRAVGSNLEKPLWEWPVPNGVGAILDVLPARAENAAVVVVRSENTAYGLGGRTGQLRWRCEGTGQPTGVLAGAVPEGTPQVLYHVSKPECTICRQALPVQGGRYGQPSLAPVAYDPSAEDPWLTVPLPWENEGRKGVRRTLLPFLACFGFLAYFAWKRQWRIVLGLVACLLVVPLAVAGFELAARENRHAMSAEQHYSWHGWYWLWPYVLSSWEGWTLLRNPLPWMVASFLWLRTRRAFWKSRLR
jgi:outer membrane protein assembly factor BamB